jgi:ribosomal protein L16/L10AE
VEKKKVVKHKEDGLIVLLVVVKTDQDLVVEKTHQRVVKGDVGQLALLVKHIKEGRVLLELV